MTHSKYSIRNAPGITCFDGATETALRRLPVRLPAAHERLLRMTDGITSGFGYIRVFGVSDQVRDQVAWNEVECWRFAWPDHCVGYWFFAETAHGAQFAYEVHSNGVLSERVLYINQCTPPSWTLPNFETFFQNVVMEDADKAADPAFEPTLKRLGQIPPDKLVVPFPHPCLGGTWAGEEVMLLDAREAMIMNADLWYETERVGELTAESRVESYSDARGRTRVRIV